MDTSEDAFVGDPVGCFVGLNVGFPVGVFVGFLDGLCDGFGVEEMVKTSFSFVAT